ncbi:MsnO8 family LLM class oxidoreductase [Streptomyces xiamenensis]
MDATTRTVRWSVLDRALIRRGQSAAGALRETVEFAAEIERLGYRRFWVAEHHAVPGIAGSAPTVLAAAVAAATSRIRVGTGGVMLPNHRPLVVAEQFGVLEAIFPGRIDMGLGRSVGFTGPVRRALGVDKSAADRFDEQLTELMSYFGERPTGGTALTAMPSQGLRVPAHLLAVGSGADIAAAHGLPVVMALHADTDRTVAALERYRAGFRPSVQQPRPYVLLAVNAAVAATHEAAALLQLPEAWATARSRIDGAFPPLDPPREIAARSMTERERGYVEQSRAGQLYGDGPAMATRLDALIARTGADEVLVTLNTHDPADRVDSYRRLAALAGLPGGAA